MTEASIRLAPAAPRRSRPRRSATGVIVLAILLVGTLVPLLYLLSVSFMTRGDVSAGLVVPPHPAGANWAHALDAGIVPGVLNSLVAAIAGAAITLLFAIPASWAIVRYRTGGRTLAGTLLSPWLLPPIVAVIPLFTLLRILELNNTLLGLSLVYGFANIAVAVWLLEGFVRRLPPELDEAAQIDGAGPYRVLVSVIAPVLVPAIVAVGVITAILNYDEFLLAAFITQSPDSQTAPVVLTLMLGERITDYGKLAAASVMAIIPVFAIATLLQRWLVEGLTSGATR